MIRRFLALVIVCATAASVARGEVAQESFAAGRTVAIAVTSDFTRVALGAETRAYLVSHLREVLKGSVPADGTIGERSVRWILSLAERHHSLYVTAEDGDVTLLIQDANGQTVDRGTLTALHRTVWDGL